MESRSLFEFTTGGRPERGFQEASAVLPPHSNSNGSPLQLPLLAAWKHVPEKAKLEVGDYGVPSLSLLLP